MIILFTGQPSAGKTTIAKGLLDRLCSVSDGKGVYLGKLCGEAKSFVHLDGDALREVFDDADFSIGGRIKNLERAINIARYLEWCGHIPVMSLIFPFRHQREELMRKTKVAQIYAHFDPKRDMRSKIDRHVGYYEPPLAFDGHLKLDTTDLTVVEAVAQSIEYIESIYKKIK